jgi:hypothetical protein
MGGAPTARGYKDTFFIDQGSTTTEGDTMSELSIRELETKWSEQLNRLGIEGRSAEIRLSSPSAGLWQARGGRRSSVGSDLTSAVTGLLLQVAASVPGEPEEDDKKGAKK